MKHYVYLCGPIKGLTYEEATLWRQQVALKMNKNMITLDPLRDSVILKNEPILSDEYKNHPFHSADMITTRDRIDCLRADIVIANFLNAKTVSIGSMIEVGWADAKRIPIIGIIEENNIHKHAMLNEILSFTVTTVDEAVKIVNHIYGE